MCCIVWIGCLSGGDVMNETCKRCGSFAINQHMHGREKGIDLDLCDVCYWRKRAEEIKKEEDDE